MSQFKNSKQCYIIKYESKYFILQDKFLKSVIHTSAHAQNNQPIALLILSYKTFEITSLCLPKTVQTFIK
jgi:hypothetical protein